MSGSTSKSKSTKSLTAAENALAEQYQQKTDRQHILDNPDTYIGSTDLTTEELWVYDEKQNKMVKETLTFCPGEYKIFDEILVINNFMFFYNSPEHRVSAGSSAGDALQPAEL